MKSSKKLGVALLAVATALAVLVISAFALFSDGDNASTKGQIGTVEIGIVDDEVTLSNDDNLNPGDYDPNNPDDANPGTPHDLEFAIENLGNKSIDLRNTIVLYVTEKDNAEGLHYNPLLKGTDGNYLKEGASDELYVSVFKLYGKLKTGDPHGDADATTELTPKFFMVKGSDAIHPWADIGSTAALSPDNVVAVIYKPAQDVLSGNNDLTGYEPEEDAEGDEYPDFKEFTYYLAMDRRADNNFQDLTLNIDVIAEAKQHRNTTDDDWDIVVTKSLTVNGKDYDVVPDVSEDNRGIATTLPTP